MLLCKHMLGGKPDCSSAAGCLVIKLHDVQPSGCSNFLVPIATPTHYSRSSYTSLGFHAVAFKPLTLLIPKATSRSAEISPVPTVCQTVLVNKAEKITAPEALMRYWGKTSNKHVNVQA